MSIVNRNFFWSEKRTPSGTWLIRRSVSPTPPGQWKQWFTQEENVNSWSKGKEFLRQREGQKNRWSPWTYRGIVPCVEQNKRCVFCFVLFFGGIGVWTQSFMLARQAYYHFSCTPSPFIAIRYLSNTVLCFLPGTGLGLWSSYLCLFCSWDYRHVPGTTLWLVCWDRGLNWAVFEPQSSQSLPSELLGLQVYNNDWPNWFF
jgi:hypothetical protein